MARSEAKRLAIATSNPIAIVIEDGEYRLYEAFFAYNNQMNVKEVVSHL